MNLEKELEKLEKELWSLIRYLKAHGYTVKLILDGCKITRIIINGTHIFNIPTTPIEKRVERLRSVVKELSRWVGEIQESILLSMHRSYSLPYDYRA